MIARRTERRIPPCFSDTVDDDNCDNLRTAQYTSSITLGFAALNLVLYLALAHYGSVSPNFLALSAVLTCIQGAVARRMNVASADA